MAERGNLMVRIIMYVLIYIYIYIYIPAIVTTTYLIPVIS